MGARIPSRVPTGWCSWYYFYNQVSQADVLANLEAMARHKHPAEVVQVDDGFQSATGDWLTPNQRFPDGMAFLSRRIAEAGYRPGLWLAPLVLHESSAALRERPELALRTPSGDLYWIECWLGRCAVLDCSRPAGESWLREVIRTSVRDWGYSYLKLDAMAFAAAPAREVCYADPRLTGPAHLRRGLQIIREEAGEEVFLLGCTCHFGSAVGLVEGMRVSPDVKALWADGTRPSVRQAMRMTLQRGFMHGRFWVNDPDCLIVRETETALGEAEVRFLATGIALSGGMVVLSDDLPRLGPERRSMALALFPPTGVAARPLDPWEAPVASAWRSELGGGRALLGLLNWTDRPCELDPAALLGPGEVAFDLWNGELVGAARRPLRPREGALWQVSRPAPPPRWVGDTGHLTGEGLEVVSGPPALLRNRRPYPRRVVIDLGTELKVLELAAGETLKL
jgi:alpha-galactosidase